MKKRFLVFFVAATFIVNAVGFVSADTRSARKQVNPLLALLPASDAVVSIDAKRFYDSALPQILSGDKEMLDDINGEIDAMKQNTGIDVRQFEHIAVGIAFNKVSETDIDLEPVALARGNFNASSLPALAKYASNDKYREEKIGDRTVYIFSAKEMIEKKSAIVRNSALHKLLESFFPPAAAEVAITVYDAKTLAFGTLERLKLMLTDEKSRVDVGLLTAVNRSPNALVSFAAKFPNGISGFIKLSDDELGRSLNSIRRISGNIDVTAENVSVSLAAKTFDIPHAQGLHKNLTTLRDFGAGLLGSSKNPNNKIYARLAGSTKIRLVGSEVLLDLLIPQTDIKDLIGAK